MLVFGDIENADKFSFPKLVGGNPGTIGAGGTHAYVINITPY